ncbi:hypothetical protein B7H23_10725 [Notoacmeibacter marinus]|uniref:Glutamine amidotransferase domain-containing protein n=1 Tax=Notoacmeibacter marinus TaxID=1876515 RepID=A0A231UXM6_9HYPH|nr:hypothetical protein [Notoacmeibacter marinus]OXT00571.1 hypothetical protein B7H23_10725 [Notoacmeibacter marinus]
MTDQFSLAFEPLVPMLWLIVLAVPLIVFIALGFVLGRRGAFIRALAAALLFLAVTNPVVLREERDPLTSIVAVVVDRSQSQEIGERRAQTDEALAELRERIGALPQFELRVDEAGGPSDDSDRTRTRLFESLNALLGDVAPSRVAGAVFITDGQIHDVPDGAAQAGIAAPVHGLITGEPDEFDRRIRLERAPRFALVGQPVELTYRVLSDGKPAGAGGPERGAVDVTIRLNGEEVARQRAFIGEETAASVELPNAGRAIVELDVAEADGELTRANNTAIANIDGIRENLRVLLVSGEPHAGERAWRNLLKSDAAVDLVHFTILRPPEKQDGTPINELSLIAFPTRELFVEKIDEFDLIIFDRYQHRDVLPILYYDYIAEYVRNGGALLVAAGPEYASEQSISRTPLLPALPALPTGEVSNAAFHPVLSELGERHPVTRNLDGSSVEPPAWSRWFRQIAVQRPRGQVVMHGLDEAPLLILDRVGEGRVGMLLSDQGWLWARGFEGGGPHVQLYRRMAHWLMKQPELEEERLVASGDGMVLEIVRQSMAEEIPPAIVTGPDGERIEASLTEDGPGIFSTRLQMKNIGLHRVQNGDMSAIAHIGPLNAPEFADTISTIDTLMGLAGETGGTVRRLSDGMPAIAPIKPGTTGSERFVGLRETDETILRSVDRTPLLAGFAGLGAILLLLGGMWWREGR